MEFTQIVNKRYATKKFDNTQIPEKQIEQLKELIRLAPSSYNIQPWKIIIVTDPKIKEQLAPAAYDQAQITTCSHLFVFCANTDIESHVELLAEDISNEYLNTIRSFTKNLQGDKRLSWAQRQTYIALGNALNGAKSLGFDSCPMEGFQPDKFKEILKLSDNLHPTVLCPVGIAADEAREKIRFSEEEIYTEK